MLEIETIPNVGELPEPTNVELVPGETSAKLKHYRNKKTGSPQCGADPEGAGVYARKWDDVTCPACVAARSPAGRKKDEPQPKAPKKAEKPAEAPPAALGLDSSEFIEAAILEVIKRTRRAPPAREPVKMFSKSVSGCLVYYELLPENEEVHPLAALAISSYMLYSAISSAEVIEDDKKLEEAWSRV